MPVQHENRCGKDRRRFNLSAFTVLEKERRWNKDRRRSADDEDELYDPDWDALELDQESRAGMSLGD